MKRMSFRLKTILGIAIIEAALLVLLVWSGVGYLRATNEDALGVRANSTAHLFAAAIKDAVLSTDLASLQSFFDQLSSNRDLAYAHFTDAGGRVLAERGRPADRVGPVVVALAPIAEGTIQFGFVEIAFEAESIDRSVNEAFRVFAGLAAVEMVLVAIFSFVLGTHLTRHLKELERGALRVAAGEGGVRVPVHGRDELATTATAFNTMVARVAESERRLTGARDEALAAERAKSAFLATMSHEIRTPLNGMIGTLQLMEGAGEAHRAELIGVARRSSEQLLALLNDVLDLAALDAGRVELVQGPLDLGALVRDAVALFGPSCEGKGLTLRAAISPDPPPSVLGDSGRLFQIVAKLVGNAIKFTERGGVTFTFTVMTESGEGASRLTIAVADTGIGIAEDVQETVFDPFSRGGLPTAIKQGGAGLGLAIVRRLVEAMGGEVGLRSTLGGGATFTVVIPVIADPGMAAVTTFVGDLVVTSGAEPVIEAVPSVVGSVSDAALVGNGVLGRVLVAEDNAVNAMVVSEMVKRLGLDLVIAKDGMEAIRLATSEPFDLILLDYHMPGHNGPDVARAVRQSESGRESATRTPMVALTANASSAVAEECLAAGMDACLSKPIRFRDLACGLSQYLPIDLETVLKPRAKRGLGGGKAAVNG